MMHLTRNRLTNEANYDFKRTGKAGRQSEATIPMTIDQRFSSSLKTYSKPAQTEMITFSALLVAPDDDKSVRQCLEAQAQKDCEGADPTQIGNLEAARPMPYSRGRVFHHRPLTGL
ncbi:MAG: hypothetical protein WBO55_12310 [Rhizobiaceae bacterium]